MFTLNAEKFAARFTSFGVIVATCLIFSRVSTDPVNVPKFVALGGLATGLLGILIAYKPQKIWSRSKLLVISVGLFVISLFISLIGNSAPLSQMIYGAYGRNTGLLTYLFLAIIFVAISLFNTSNSIKLILYAFFVSALINIAYCTWVLAFGDFVGWNNPSGNLLGLFGNPNFISAFLGMFITGALAFVFAEGTKWSMRILILGLALLSFIEILETKSIQGLVVTVGGSGLVIFYFILTQFKSRIPLMIYSIFAVVTGVMAIFGALQKGPFDFVYKKSVSLRGTYWKTGIEMGTTNPFSGVGLDSYGDWYRRARPPIALLDTPGPGITSNASHNVFIDFFAAGGFPLLVTYIGINTIVLFFIIKTTKSLKKFNPYFVALASAWICYQVQSLISINQIGLALWGWVLGGALIAYSRILIEEDLIASSVQYKAEKKSIRTVRNEVFTPQLIAGVGTLIGVLIALPPLNSDAKWFNAINSTSAIEVEKALQPTFMTPQNSMRYMQAVNLFATNNLPELALKYARAGVKFNPDDFEIWRQFYFLTSASPAEKSVALQNMKRLDPLNPDVASN